MPFLNKQERRGGGFHFSFAEKHGGEGEVKGEKDFFRILTFCFNMKNLSKATNKRKFRRIVKGYISITTDI